MRSETTIPHVAEFIIGLRIRATRWLMRATLATTVSGRDAARSTSRSAASQNRDPGFFELQVTGTPALQRTTP